MAAAPSQFYDKLAEHYHWMFEDWQRSINRQATALDSVFLREIGTQRLRILDCACGIGTQTLGLANLGHKLTGSDLSPGAIARARREAAHRGLNCTFQIADLRSLAAVDGSAFDVVMAADNALPHLLTDDDMKVAIESMASKLRPGGLLVATIRDYDEARMSRPLVQGPAFYQDGPYRRISHQIWDWLDEQTYQFHVHISRQTPTGWLHHHSVATYRAWLRAELGEIVSQAGLQDVRWLMPAESGFYQPMVIATRPEHRQAAP